VKVGFVDKTHNTPQGTSLPWCPQSVAVLDANGRNNSNWQQHGAHNRRRATGKLIT